MAEFLKALESLTSRIIHFLYVIVPSDDRLLGCLKFLR